MPRDTLLPSTGDSIYDKIAAYYIDPLKYELKGVALEIKYRLVEAHSLRLNYFTREQTVNKLKEKYGISTAQAYKDVRNSESLFGSVNKVNKEGLRAIMFEHSTKLFQRAIKAKDLKAQAKALELMGKYGGLDSDDDLGFNPDKLLDVKLKVSLPKFVEEAMMAQINTGSIDFNKLPIEDAQIIADE